jgi:hypothetical protein
MNKMHWAKAEWKKIKDDRVRHTWVCPKCNIGAFVFPDFFEKNGTPICTQCDEDMEYRYTETLILVPKKRKE